MGRNRCLWCRRIWSYAGHSRVKCFKSSTLSAVFVRCAIFCRHSGLLSAHEHNLHNLRARGTRLNLPVCTSNAAYPILSLATHCNTLKGMHNLVYLGALLRSNRCTTAARGQPEGTPTDHAYADRCCHLGQFWGPGMYAYQGLCGAVPLSSGP